MAPASFHRTSDASNLSPRQRFQNEVRSLSSDDVPKGHRRNQSISLNYNPYELHHVSSLRVQSPGLRSTRRSPVRSVPNELRHVIEEPEFVLEERKAWSRRSPESNIHKWSSKDNNHFLIYDEEQSEDEIEAGKQLKPFAPLKYPVDVDDRPKTSRGNAQAQVQIPTIEVRPTSMDSPTRSKFAEGSMNTRSQGVASSWTDHLSDYDTSASETEDEHSTPKAAQHERDGSFDLQDFAPASVSSSTVKRTLFRRKNSSKPIDEASKHKKEGKSTDDKDDRKKAKKKLRRSLSNWSLHSIGEKIGLFHDNSSNVGLGDTKQVSNTPNVAAKPNAILDERKRKAEIAYAQQFGTKRQKDNAGASTTSDSSQVLKERQPTLRRKSKGHDLNATIRASSAAYDPYATIKARTQLSRSELSASTTTHTNHEPPQPASTQSSAELLDTVRMTRSSTRSLHKSLGPSECATIFRPDGSIDHDMRKRPSRRELEKENQQLREMLRQSQVKHSRNISTGGNNSLDHTESTTGVQMVPPRSSSQRKSLSTIGNVDNAMGLHAAASSNHLPISEHGTQGLDQDRAKPSLALAPRQSLPNLPRSVSMIVEEPENEEDEESKKASHAATIASPKTFKLRRRSLHISDPVKRPVRRGKENNVTGDSHSLGGSLVGGVGNDWKGWDDDVF